MAEANPPSFQMHGCRAALLPVAAAFEPQVQAIEDSIQRVPDFAFDLSKTLVESVCRTVLGDLGFPADPAWDCPKLLRESRSNAPSVGCCKRFRDFASFVTALAWPPTGATSTLRAWNNVRRHWLR